MIQSPCDVSNYTLTISINADVSYERLLQATNAHQVWYSYCDITEATQSIVFNNYAYEFLAGTYSWRCLKIRKLNLKLSVPETGAIAQGHTASIQLLSRRFN